MIGVNETLLVWPSERDEADDMDSEQAAASITTPKHNTAAIQPAFLHLGVTMIVLAMPVYATLRDGSVPACRGGEVETE